MDIFSLGILKWCDLKKKKSTHWGEIIIIWKLPLPWDTGPYMNKIKLNSDIKMIPRLYCLRRCHSQSTPKAVKEAFRLLLKQRHCWSGFVHFFPSLSKSPVTFKDIYAILLSMGLAFGKEKWLGEVSTILGSHRILTLPRYLHIKLEFQKKDSG